MQELIELKQQMADKQLDLDKAKAEADTLKINLDTAKDQLSKNENMVIFLNKVYTFKFFLILPQELNEKQAGAGINKHPIADFNSAYQFRTPFKHVSPNGIVPSSTPTPSPPYAPVTVLYNPKVVK